MDTAFRLILLLIMFVGLVGSLVPIFPGTVLIWAAALVYGLKAGFDPWWPFAVITLLMLVSVVADNVVMSMSAAQRGAAWYSSLAAMVAALVGSFLWPPFGGLVLAVIVLLGIEFARHRDWRRAWEASKGYLLGCGWAALVRFGLALVMIGVWWVWAW